MLNLIRNILGSILVFFDRVFAPRPIERAADLQKDVDEQAKDLTLYYFPRCPFCIKVNRKIRHLNLTIEKRDIRQNEAFNKELIEGGGKRQVPCLCIHNNGNVTWLYESTAINRYLDDRFAPAQLAG